MVERHPIQAVSWQPIFFWSLSRYKSPSDGDLVKSSVDAGKLGHKCGEGFYNGGK
jgi:hypothetical protein